MPRPTEISFSACKKLLSRGAEIRLPDGGKGIYLEKLGRAHAWCLSGDMTGPKVAHPVEGIIRATWGVSRKK